VNRSIIAAWFAGVIRDRSQRDTISLTSLQDRLRDFGAEQQLLHPQGALLRLKSEQDCRFNDL